MSFGDMTGDEIKKIEDTWKRFLDLTLYAKESPDEFEADEIWRKAIRWVLAYVFGEGDLSRYEREPLFHAQVDVAIRMIMQLHDPGRALAYLKDLHRREHAEELMRVTRVFDVDPLLEELFGIHPDRHTP